MNETEFIERVRQLVEYATEDGVFGSMGGMTLSVGAEELAADLFQEGKDAHEAANIVMGFPDLLDFLFL